MAPACRRALRLVGSPFRPPRRRPSHRPRQRLNKALRSWGVRQDHIPRGRTIPMGAVPILARGLGHTAPTYLRRRPGSPSNGLLGPALLTRDRQFDRVHVSCRSRSHLRRSQVGVAPSGARPPPRRRTGDARGAERAARPRRPRVGAALAAARRRRLLADPRRARRRAAARRPAGARLRHRAAGRFRPLDAARLPPVARRRTAGPRRVGRARTRRGGAPGRTRPAVRAARRLRSARPSHRLRRRPLRSGAEAAARQGPIRAVGVAYAVSEIDAAPDEPHDERLDFILTEREWIDARGRG